MPLRLDILDHSPDWIAVNKPAGLATIPGRAENDTVLARVGELLDLPSAGTTDPRIRVVHRLDKDTSGVLLFATNRATQRHFSHQFQNNTVSKEYLALVVGRPSASEGEIDAPLARHPSDPKRMAVAKHGGRPARTRWRIEAKFRAFTLLRVFPQTGKTHQIRVHLKHAGMPLAIDPLYHPRAPGKPAGIFLHAVKRDYRPTAGEEERPLIDRLTLHAEKLRIVAPDGAELNLLAPLPKDFRATINQLRRHGS